MTRPRLPDAVETWIGGRVVAATSSPGGFSPGVAARLRTQDGRRIFVKAAGPEPNPDTPVVHRREAKIVSALPPDVPVPRLLWSYEEDGWIVLVFEDVDGRNPSEPWRSRELERTLDALSDLSTLLTPSPLPPSTAGSAGEWSVVAGGHWQKLARERPVRLDGLADLETGAPEAAAGDTLLHLDVRADNLLLTPDRVVLVDWPHARVGAAWVDLAFFAPSVVMQGGPGPEVLMSRHTHADDGAVNAVVAAMAGFFTREGLQPAPPGLPTLRAFQAAQGEAARGWPAGPGGGEVRLRRPGRPDSQGKGSTKPGSPGPRITSCQENRKGGVHDRDEPGAVQGGHAHRKAHAAELGDAQGQPGRRSGPGQARLDGRLPG